MHKISLLISVLFATVLSAILIWIVGLLGLGLTIDGPRAAFLAGLAIGIIGGLITWIAGLLNLKLGAGIPGAVVNVLLGAVVLLLGDRFIAGLHIAGFAGALIASLAIGLISWLLSIPLKGMNQAVAQEK